jgi:hypothetical protein
MTRLSTIRVLPHELQRKFNNNEGGYPSKLNTLGCSCIYDELANAKSRQPPGTRSQVFKYFDGNLTVMVLHCFVLPSGELGASKKMDPKRLLVDGIYYYC